MENNKWYNTRKWLVMLLFNNFLCYCIVQGIKDPNIVGFVTDHYGTYIEPDTTLVRIAGFAIAFLFYFYSVIYLISKK